MDDDVRNNLIKLFRIAERSNKLQDLIIVMLTDHSNVLYDSFERCNVEQCSRPATLEHRIGGLRTCDRHAAESICAKDSIEDDWHDVEFAQSIRRIIDHVTILGEMPEDSDAIPRGIVRQ